MTVEEIAIVELAGCPTWATGTIMLRDAAGNVAGYAFIERLNLLRARITSEPSPGGVALLSSPRQVEGG